MSTIAATKSSAGVLPPIGPARTLALAQLVNSVGDGAFYVASALYFTRVVGLSAAEVGAGLTVGWAVGTLAGVPLGRLADRYGPRETAVALAAATAAAVAGLLFVRSLPAFLLVICLYTCGQCGLLAARQALLAGLVDEGRRTRVRAYLQSALNGGIAVGATIGGIALYLDGPAAYLSVLAMDAACFAAAALLLRRVPAVTPGASAPRRRRTTVLRDRRYVLITALHSVLLLNMPLLSLIIPLWIARETAAPGWTAAAVMVLNTLGVVAFQVRLARGVTGLHSAARRIRWSGAVLAVACAVYALSAGASAWVAFGVLAVAALVQVLGEMLLAPGAWEVSFGLAPADEHGRYQGIFGAGTSVARMLGPVALTVLVLEWKTAGWLVLGAVFLGASLAMSATVRSAPHPAVR